MAICVICPNCGAEYSAKHKKCPKCGAKKQNSFRITITHKGTKIKKMFTGINLTTAKEIERKLKTELVESKYIERDKSIPFNVFMESFYFPTEKKVKKPSSFKKGRAIIQTVYKAYFR